MRALICREFGEVTDLEVGELPEPEPGPGQVLVQVRACGVNFPDVLIIQGKYQFTPPLPFSPGAEVAGTVASVGPGVTDLVAGDPVIAVTLWGGMAERLVVDRNSVTRMSPDVDMINASSLLMAHGTAHHALFDRGQLSSGETLLVLGAGGGVGLAAVELGALRGARVLAAASSDAKLQHCLEQGAHHVIDLRKEDLRDAVKRLTDGRGVDVCLDPVGGELAEPAVRSLAWRGRYLVVGFAAGSIPRIPLNLPLLKGASIVGVFWGAFREKEPVESSAGVNELLTDLAASRLRPVVSEVFPLEKAVDALQAMSDRRAVGKLVVTIA